MKRYNPLLTLIALVMLVMAAVPAASAHPITPIRADGTAQFVGTGWAYDFEGDLECGAFAEVPEVRVNGDFVEGTMHWFEIMTVTCADGTMTIESYGTWTFDNGKFRVNGTVVDASGAYAYLIGARAHQSGLVDPAVFPFAGTLTLRIN
jgi:hypothetical protein